MPREKLSYWERREKERYKTIEKEMKNQEAYTLRQYRKMSDDINKDVYAMYAKYAEENALTLVEARKVLNKTETKNFHRKMKAYRKELREGKNTADINRKISAMEKRSKIKRLDAINMEIESRIALQASRQVDQYANYKKRVAKSSFALSQASLLKKIDVRPRLDTLTNTALTAMTNYPLDGQYFSEKIWNDTAYVAQKAQYEVLNGIVTGQHVRTTAQNLDKIMGRGYKNAERLIRTETTLIIAQAGLESFKSVDVEMYEYAAIMDERTSSICREFDGKRFKVSEGVSGVNMPSMHANCRSVIVPVFEDDDLDNLT